MRFLSLGDSYTIGEGVAPEDRWPNQLASALRANEIAVDDPLIVARTAWTTDELFEAIDAARPAPPFDLVSLLVGVNDQYRGRPVSSFEPEFALLLERAIQLAGGEAPRVMALSIPDWGATPFAEGRDRALIRREIGAYNASGARLAANAGVPWFDVTTPSRRMLVEPALVASDGLHPSAALYAQWAQLLLPYATKVLGAGDG